MITAGIFDRHGVLRASLHEQAWRKSLVGFVEPDRFTSQLYQEYVTDKPRLGGMRAALTAFHVLKADTRATSYVELKHSRLSELLDGGGVIPFLD